MSSEFDERFEERILNRGYEYYKNEAVQDVHEKDDAIVAKIVGSETYKVYVLSINPLKNSLIPFYLSF